MASSPRPITEFLRRLKQRRLIPLPGEPETLREVLERASQPGCVGEIRREVYFELLRREKPAVRLLYHYFLVGADDRVRLFWFDPETRRNFGCALTEDQALEFARLFQVRELLQAIGRPELGAPGYGPFALEDLLPGEDFIDRHERDGRVCKEQPELDGLVAVWIHPNGGNPLKLLLPRSVLVYASGEAQAERVTRRVAERGRRATKRHQKKRA